MTKTFCDVCGKAGGVLELEVVKTVNEVTIALSVFVSRRLSDQAHICDPCASDLLQEAVVKLQARIASQQFQVESQ